MGILLYNFLYTNEGLFSFLRLFNYISFRASFAFMTAFLIALIAGRRIISYLYRQGLRETAREVTDIIIQDKRGTPTMGGIIIILAITVSAVIWCDFSVSQTIWPLTALIYFGSIGYFDDRLKVSSGSSDKGMSRTMKLLLQGLFGGAFGFVIYMTSSSPFPQDIATQLYIPFYKNPIIDLNFAYILFAIFVIMAISNAVNFADGLDGLAIVPSCTTVGVFGVFAYITGHLNFSSYLLIEHIPGSGEITVLSAAVIGAGLGFLWYNAHPAQIFMGDTGSQALGGLIAVMAILIKQEFLFLIAGGIFLAEAVSVLVQDRIGIARIGKRLFYRAPLHHTFQFRGLAESTVVVRFWIISVMLALLSLATLKIR